MLQVIFISIIFISTTSNKKELTRINSNDFFYSERYDNAGIQIESLSADEITSIVVEKINILESKSKESKEDKLLQESFWKKALKLKKFAELNGFIHPKARISLTFVKRQKNWLN